MAGIKKTIITNVDKDLEKLEPSYTGGDVKPLWKTIWQSSKKLNKDLQFDQAILLLGIYPREMETYVHSKTGTQMFIAALPAIVKGRNNPNLHQFMSGFTKYVYPYNGILFSCKKQ